MSVPLAPSAPSFTRRLALRCGVVYAAAYFLPAPLDGLPYLEERFGWHFALWDACVSRVAGLLDIALPARPFGSGDTTWNWLQVAIIAVLALAGGLAWTLARSPRGPREDERLRSALAVYLRIVLATVLASYGMAKVFPTQFPATEPELLLVSYGESSPMGLLWRFMAHSPAYAAVCGAIETLAGLLLLFRRTRALGALAATAVMFHVVLLNLCFDVPVKLYSTQLLAGCAALAAADRARFAPLLGAGDASPAERPAAPARARRWPALERARPLLAPAYVALLIVLHVHEGLAIRREDREAATPLHGIYRVESCEPARARERAWDWWAIGRTGRAIVRERGFVARQFRCEVDEAEGTIAWRERDVEGAEEIVWRYATERDADGELLTLEGVFDGAPARVVSRRIDVPRMQLRERGFRWINETSWNR